MCVLQGLDVPLSHLTCLTGLAWGLVVENLVVALRMAPSLTCTLPVPHPGLYVALILPSV